MSENNFKLKVQAVLDKVKSVANIKADIKAIESKLPKLKIQGTLNTTSTRKELNSKLKSIKPKVKVDADTTQAEKKIKKIGKQKTNATITPTVDTTQVVSGLKKAQKETKTLWERFVSGAIGANLVRMSVQKVTQAIHEAVKAVKELDTIKTNIQMVSGSTDSEVNSMMQSYNAMAKELSSTTKEVGEAANEFLRMGESVASTNELIKNATILSKVGMIDSADAASYLISSMKGYQVSAEDSINIVSKLTAVDLEAAVSAGGLAEAISRCSNIANNSGTSMNRLIGYAASIGEVTQESMSVVGNSLKSMYSRMNNIKIGRYLDEETGESLSDTEAVLNKLGIKLRDTENTYRDFDDVLDDVGMNWKNFTQIEQNAISVAIAGTMQRERFTALMNNYSSALEYSEVAANSAGSALERYGVFQDSIEAKTNELTAAIESLSTNIISEDLYSGILQATTGLVEFLDKTNLLKGTLAGLVAMGVSKAIVSIGTGFITAAKSTAQLTAAMALFDKGKSTANLKAIGAACKGLSDKQLKLILSTKGLKDTQRLTILEGMGLEEQEREQMLTTLGFAAAEDKATASTLSFKGAMNSLKVAFASNPIGFIITGIATAVSIATMAFSLFKQKQEEAAQALQDAISEYESAKSSLESINSELEEQNKKIDELLAKDKLTYAEKGQLEELQAITQELLLQQDIEERRADKASKDVADKTIDAYNKQYGKYDNTEDGLNKRLSYEGFPLPESTDDIVGMIAAYIRAQELLEQSQKEFDDAVKNGEDTTWIAEDVQFNIDAVDDYRQALDENISDLQEKRLALEDEYNKAIEKRESGVEPLTSFDKDVIETYESIYDAMKMLYEYTDQNAWNNMEISNIFNTEGIEKTKDELAAMAKAGELTPETITSYKNLNEAVQNSELFLNDGQTAAQAFCDEIYGYIEAADELVEGYSKSPTLSISSTIDQLNTQLKPAFDSLKSAYQDIFTDDGFTLENVDLSMLDSIKSKLDELNKLEGANISIDYSSFENLARVLTDTSSTADDVQVAFNSLATDIVDALNPAISECSGENYKLVQSLLESVGIMNSEEVMVSSLGYTYEEYIAAKEETANAGFDLANATESEIDAFVREALESGNCGQALALLQLKKLLVNSTSINTASDIQQIMNLASAAGMGAEVLTQLANAKSILGAVESGGAVSLNSYQKALDDVQSAKQTMLDWKPVKVDFSNVGGGKKSASKAGKEAADAYLEAFEKELSELDDLKSRGKITEKQYLDALRKLYVKYFNQKKKYLKEFEKYEHQYLDGMKSLYESAFSYITKQIDKRIDAINDEKDAAISALEARRDAELAEIEAKKE